MPSHRMQPIPKLVRDYGNGNPVIAECYRPRRGWQEMGYQKRVSEAFLRKLQKDGIERVSLHVRSGPTGMRVRADYTVRELLASAREGRRSA